MLARSLSTLPHCFVCLAAVLVASVAVADTPPPISKPSNSLPGPVYTTLPSNLFEDKSPASHLVLPSANLADLSELVGLVDAKALVKRVQDEHHMLAETYPEWIFGIGSAVRLGPGQPVYASSLFVSANFGLDLAYQRTYGDRRTINFPATPLNPNPQRRYTPDGDSISFRFDPVHVDLKRTFDELNNARQHFLEAVGRPYGETYGRRSKRNKAQQGDGNQPKAFDNLSNEMSQNPEDTKRLNDALTKIFNVVNNDSPPSGNKSGPHNTGKKYRKIFEDAANKFNQEFGSIRAAVVGGYSSYRDIGAIGSAGVSVSYLFPLNVKAAPEAVPDALRDYSHASGLLVATDIRSAWYAPSALFRNNNIGSRSALRFGAVVAWQDKFTHYLKSVPPKPVQDGIVPPIWTIRKWTFQLGLEYNRASELDGGDYYGVFTRYRTGHFELNAGVGHHNSSGTLGNAGLIFYF